MGIDASAMPATTRSRATSATYTAIALVFFFGVGLAGGAAYRWLSPDAPDSQLADRVPTQPALPAFAPPPDAAPDPGVADTAAPDLARIEPAAPPALAPPPAPMPVADAAPAAFTPPDAPAAQLAPDAVKPMPYAAVAPPAAAARPVVTHRPAAPPAKPHLAAKASRPAAPQAVALHAPPAAPGNLIGPYRVQFGAFANEDNARRVQWAIEATGVKAEVTQAPGASGHTLFYLRSPAYHDYAAALSAAQTVQDRVQHFVNAIPIDYTILGDRSIEQQAQR
jgi:hypothetical protein